MMTLRQIAKVVQATASSMALPAPLSRSVSVSSSTVSVASTAVSSQTERDLKETQSQTRPPTRERERDRHLELFTPSPSTLALNGNSSSSQTHSRSQSQSQSQPRERSQVLSDVHMLDLGAYSYIPLVTAYEVEIPTEGPDAYVVTDPVAPSVILKPLPDEVKGKDMRGETSGFGSGMGWRSESGRYGNYSYSPRPGPQ